MSMSSPSVKREILSDTAPMQPPQTRPRTEDDAEWVPTSTSSSTPWANNMLKVPRTPVHKQTRKEAARYITRAVKNSKYHTALRYILSTGKAAAEKAFMRILSKKIKKEMTTFRKSTGNCFPEIDGSDSSKKFSWTTMVEDMRGQMPTLVGALESAMPSVEEEKYRYNTELIIILN